MKLSFDKHKVHIIVMVLCFIYGGFSLVVFSLQSSFLFRQERTPDHSGRIALELLNESEVYSPSIFQRPPLDPNLSRTGFWGLRRTSPYPIMIASFLGSVISLLAALSLMDLLRKKERKELTKSVIDTMTTPEEKAIIKELERNSGELTQSDLVRKTGLSKVKVHRIIKRLESLGIVSKYPYGVTNNIRLEKTLYEE